MTPPPAAWKNVNKTYRQTGLSIKALDNFSLELRPQITQGLLGANGSGKSTAVKLLLGLARPDGGRIEIFGGSPQQPELRQKIGFMPEDFQTFPNLTVEKILLLFASLKAGSASDIKQYSKKFMLAGQLKTKFKSLSRGLKQLVGLATAFTGDPELLVLDEPSTGLDPDSQQLLYKLLKKREENKKTTLIITHRIEEIYKLCQVRFLIADGQIKRNAEIDI